MLLRLLCAAFALFAAACTPSLGTFNALVPKDRASAIARNVAYGEGPRRLLDIYRPKASDEPAPVLVFFYGGSWSSGERADYEFVGRAFAAQGFLTLIPDYRLVPDVRFPAFLEDSASAVAWASEHAADYGGDPSRVVLVGHSAGAYIAAMLGLDAHYLADAGMDLTRIRGVAAISGPYDFYPFDVKASIDAFSAAPDPAATQPIAFARPDAPPLLLLWGEKDDTVGRHNIENLAAAIRAKHGAVETKLYPRAGHIDIMLALSRPLRSHAPTLADVSSFAHRITKQDRRLPAGKRVASRLEAGGPR